MADATHNRTAFFRALRDAQGPLTAEQAAGFTVLLDGFQADDLLDHLPIPAYLLATAWHETGKTMQPIAEWDRRFLKIAREVATWSKDPSTQVGAVIVDQDQRVVSLGYNGLPRGVSDSRDLLDDRVAKYATVIHAEQNALLFAARPVAGCTCYTWPLPPCSHCAALLIQVGIARVVFPLDVDPALSARWQDSLALARQLFADPSPPVSLVGVPNV